MDCIVHGVAESQMRLSDSLSAPNTNLCTDASLKITDSFNTHTGLESTTSPQLYNPSTDGVLITIHDFPFYSGSGSCPLR